MTSDKLQSIWNRGKQRGPIMDQLTIDRILDKSAREGWSGIRINVWVFLVMLVVSELFHILNLAALFDRPAWLAVNAVLALVTLGFLLFGLRVQRELRELDDSAVSLATLVKRQLRFFHTTFEWWAWMWSITVWMMSYCVVVWGKTREAVPRRPHHRVRCDFGLCNPRVVRADAAGTLSNGAAVTGHAARS